MENSNIVKIENNGKKMITLSDNLIYNHIVPNLDKRHASKYEAMVAVYLDQLKNITELKCRKTFNDCKDKKKIAL